MSDNLLQRSVTTAVARNLANTTKTSPKMMSITPRWVLSLLPWTRSVSGGLCLLVRILKDGLILGSYRIPRSSRRIIVKSVQSLKAERQLIERGLNLLEKAVERINARQNLVEDFLAWAVRFLQQFADKFHHAKEENVFFPVLKQRGIPEQGGPLGVMLREHVLGRRYVDQMREASQAQPLDANTFVEAAKQYIPLLRQHIFKENNVLFHMAERVMSEADDADVTSRFSQVEQERGLTGWHESFANDVVGWEQALKGG